MRRFARIIRLMWEIVFPYEIRWGADDESTLATEPQTFELLGEKPNRATESTPEDYRKTA